MSDENKISRREFIKDAAIASAAVAAAGMLNAAPAAAAPIPDKWDKEADVVVVGYGVAGASAAINAFDAGAKVLILEKLPQGQEGGNSCVCGGAIFTIFDPDLGPQYIKAMSGGTMPDDVMAALTKGMYENIAWFKSQGTEIVPVTPATYSTVNNDYPDLPGSKGALRYQIKFDNMRGSAIFKWFKAQVDKRGIEVLYGTPGKKLVQEPNTREILGVVAETAGKTIYIKGKRGVVLTTGGFEFNNDMKSNFHVPKLIYYGQGSPGNTGDGIKMAMAVGADLWHMANNTAGAPSIGLAPRPGFQAAFGLTKPTANLLYVNHYGKRFINEYRANQHGLGHWPILAFYDTELHDYPNIPCYMVFDETLRVKGPLGPTKDSLSGWAALKEGFVWSQDNSTEIGKGWIIKADTIRDLAGKLKIDPAILEATVNTYNKYADAGADPEFGRPKANLAPVKTPPYYAIELAPIILNTQGGPRRDKDAHILDVEGKPIPRLYSAGELGSVFGYIYNGGCNIGGDCIAFGRIAGKNAAAEKAWGAT